MSHRKTLLVASIVAGLCMYGSASAQDVNAASTAKKTTEATQKADASQAQTLSTVSVTGIRASLEKSLDTKRNNDTISEAITAEDIGKFPSTNVAEAMALIPGVTIDRRFGQGERVSIDGTDPSLNLSYLDGHPVAQSIWLYGEQPNRGFDYTLLAPELLGRLEVIKSSEARLPEGSLGGTVIMHSREPLDLKANSFSGSAGYNYNDQSDGGKPNFSGLYNWKNQDQTFGFNIAAQSYKEEVDRQGVEVFGYHPVSDYAAQSPAVAAQVASGQIKANAMVPDEVNSAYFQQTRRRISGNANIQFRPNDQFEATLSGLYIKENFDNYNQSIYNFIHQNAQTMGAVTSFTQGPNGVITDGHTAANATSGLVYDNQLRQSQVKTKGGDFRAAWHGDGWGLSGQLGVSKSDNPDIGQYLLEPVYFGATSWNIKKGWSCDDPAACKNPANWRGDGWMGNNGVFSSSAKDKYAQLDFTKDFDGVFNQLLIGARYTKHTENYALFVYGGVNTGGLDDVGTIGDTDILGDFNVTDGMAHHIQVGENNILNWINNSPLDFQHPDPGSYVNNTYSIEQKNTAAYAQMNFATDRLRGNFGVRWVRAETDSEAYQLPNGVAPTYPPPAAYLLQQKKTDNNWLPSFNAAYDLTSDIVLRFAAAKVVAWAPYNQLAPYTFLNDTVLTGSGGNAKVDPYKSYNFNTAIEWYFDNQSVLAASVFYKHVLNYIVTDVGTERQFNSIHDNDPAQFASLVGTGGCTADGFCDYSITRPRNAGGAKVQGLTLSYQQPFGDTGFGVSANYTFSNSSTDLGTRLPYQSKNSAALSPYWEKGPYSARITYSYRDHYLAGGYVAGAPPASVAAYTDLGFSLGWNVTETVGFTVDGMNMLNEHYIQYLGTRSMPAGDYTTGRRYMASVHVKF